jgi:suppressor of ftsI
MKIIRLFCCISLLLSWCSWLWAEEKNEVLVTSRDAFSMDEKFNIHMCLMGWGEWCDAILDPENKSLYGDAIKEQCEIMVGMEACDTYFWTSSSAIKDAFNVTPNESLPEAKQSEVVTLVSGAAYTITIDEVKKEVAGKTLRMFAYNGMIPWPTIKVPKGWSIQLTFVNNIEDIETTTHHHGLRHEVTQDGVPVDMGWFDIPLQKGESKTYTLTFPDTWVFRYHPHVREDIQQELGLYGNYLVTDPDEEYRNQVTNEELLVLDDLFLNNTGIVPFDALTWNFVVMWRFGNTSFINGQEKPVFRGVAWGITRFYITNTANVTPFLLSMSGVQMKLVGGDIGAYSREELVDSLVIAPAERYVIEVYTPTPGVYELRNSAPWRQEVLAHFEVTTSSWTQDLWTLFMKLRENSLTIEEIDRYREYFDQPPQKELILSVIMDGMSGTMIADHPHTDWLPISLPGGLTLDPDTIERSDGMAAMNAASTTDNTHRKLIDKATGKENMDIDRDFKLGEVVKIRLFNDPDSHHPMQHPMHFHGQRFLVLDKNGQTNDNLVRKDTVLIPRGEYVDILLDNTNPGNWMMHCHIAEHLTNGMMWTFSVWDTWENENMMHE